MIKAKEFLECLCNVWEFRFFAGVPCVELKALYNEMNSKLLHYIPAVTETIAVGISSGLWLTGIRSGVIMSSEKINTIFPILETINFKLKIPILFIFDDSYTISNIHTLVLNNDYKYQIDSLVDYMEEEKKPSGIIIQGGILI